MMPPHFLSVAFSLQYLDSLAVTDPLPKKRGEKGLASCQSVCSICQIIFVACQFASLSHVPGRTGLFAESAMILCTGIPCMQKLSVLVTPAPFYEPSPDTVRDFLCGLHFCYPIPSFNNSTGDGWGLITL